MQAGRCAQLPGQLRDRSVRGNFWADSGGQRMQRRADPLHLWHVHSSSQVVPLGATGILATAHAGGVFPGTPGGCVGGAGLRVGLASEADAVNLSLPGAACKQSYLAHICNAEIHSSTLSAHSNTGTLSERNVPSVLPIQRSPCACSIIYCTLWSK